ncbi:hypothetical protein A3K64_03550 [Candidatus Micrarchaeota archaeon RBG_16_36_9]|nr:MAG: hypothetical protein A3K64_03550 [Candidatus Micrarchaeota archaeon RBG_16_36_9]
MNKVFLLVLSLAIVVILSRFFISITGFSVGEADVSIMDKLQGKITTLVFRSAINISDLQNITTEFTNIGSLPMNARIEENIYYYNATKLDPVAYYYDSSVYLMPIMKRIYKTVFTPPYYGTYYIKVRVPYETKVTEMWGVFSVVYTAPPPQQIVVVVPPSISGEINYIEKEAKIPKIFLDYQKNYNLYPDQSLLISVNVNNVGNTNIHNLRLSTSTYNLITTEVNPKVVSSLGVNKSVIFLISLSIPKSITPSVYPLDFEAISDNAREIGSISLNVTSLNVSAKDEIYQTILNYDYLMNELEKSITEAVSEGLDVSIAQRSFESAKENLNNAKDYYNSGDYDNAKDKLDKVKKNFEDVVFQLAHAQLRFYVAPAFSPFLIVILAIIAAIMFLVFLKTRKKGEKRPKLLREVSEET